MEGNNRVVRGKKYVGWSKSLWGYVLGGGYIGKKGSEGLEGMKWREKKRRDVIGEWRMEVMRDYVMEDKREYVVGCEMIE